MDLSYVQARQALMDSGRGGNEAQEILEDLAHWAPGERKFSFFTTGSYRDGRLLFMRYAGTGDQQQPVFTALEA